MSNSTYVALMSMNEQSGMSDNELLGKKIVNCLAENNGFDFEKDHVNSTVMKGFVKIELPARQILARNESP